jgi:uncharacterized GH25 family protein
MRGRSIRAAAGAAAVMAIMAGAADAHTSYMLPSVFRTADVEAVTIQAAFADVHFFRPEVAVTSDSFQVIGPDGARGQFARAETFAHMTVLDADLTQPGTYRFTTGERLGRASALFQVDGEWLALEEMVEAPGADTPQADAQTATVADVYVTKGAPTSGALESSVGRLAIRPITHPSEISRQSGFQFAVTFDGAPLDTQTIEVDREGGGYEQPAFHQSVVTDANGQAHLTFNEAGVYLIMTRFRADAPPGADTPMRSYTTSLTFEVRP